MTEVIEGVKNKIGVFKKFGEAGDEAGIRFLQTGGMLYERLRLSGEMSDDDLISWGASFSRSTLAWLNIGEDRDRFVRCTAFLDFFNYYSSTVDYNREFKVSTLQGRLKCGCGEPFDVENYIFTCLVCGTPAEEWIKKFDYSTVRGHPDVEAEIRGLKRTAVSLAKILLGMSFKSPDDMKSFILNKNNLIDPNVRTRIVEKGGGPNPNQDPSKIPGE